MIRRWIGLALPPALVAGLALGLWEVAVAAWQIPPYILPAPSLIARKLIDDWGILGPSLVFTLETAGLALLAAVIGGGLLAILFSTSKVLARSLLPFAVILQVTPIVAVAPLIIIWVDDTLAALLICAWIVAFFPILSNTKQGLDSADPNLVALFRLYGAGPWRTLWYLRLPSALPYFLGGLRISGGLALIGAVVAEFVAASGGHESGLAYRIVEAGYRLDIARMFAALALIAVSGVGIHLALSGLSQFVLKDWHESATTPGE
jgi:NitT/TauT family transport system permease protein